MTTYILITEQQLPSASHEHFFFLFAPLHNESNSIQCGHYAEEAANQYLLPRERIELVSDGIGVRRAAVADMELPAQPVRQDARNHFVP